MAKDFVEVTRSVSASLRKLRTDIPEVTAAFGTLAQAATADRVLDRKTKELIALALGVAAHCDACIGFHVQALVKAGATRQELAETLAMAVYMGGGPSLMYAADAVSAWEQLSATGDDARAAAGRAALANRDDTRAREPAL